MPRHEVDLRLSSLLFGDIFTTDEPAAIGCGAMSDRDNASVAELLEVVMRPASISGRREVMLPVRRRATS